MTAKRSSLHIADVELSVTRINRLLRPLRNKCAVLASTTSRPSGSAAPITYASSSLSLLEARAPTPLDVLHDPKHIISRTHQESRSLDAQARQIYAVTNAYRNVVQAALPEAHDGSRRALLPLTDVCAASVGRSIRGEVARCLAAIEGGPDETQETALIDELYESVPVRFRRCVSCPSSRDVWVVTSSLQLDSYCSCDMRNRRHLPQSPDAHAQSSRSGPDPRPPCGI